MDPRPFERWCLDRRSAGERPLTDDERDMLVRIRRSARWSLTWPWLGFLAYWATMIALVPGSAQADWIRGLYMFFLMLGMLLLLPVALLMTRDQWQVVVDFGRDLRENRVETFAPVSTGAPVDVEGIIEVRLPSTRLLTGPQRELGDLSTIREVAPGPIVGMRVRHHADGLPEGARLERRHLSPEEQDEIARAIRRVERVPVRAMIGGLWGAFSIWGWSTSKAAPSLTAFLGTGLGLFMSGWFLWTVFRNRVLAQRMREDVESGFALVFVPPDPEAREEEGLPHSGLPWRIAGLPAEWRGVDLVGLR